MQLLLVLAVAPACTPDFDEIWQVRDLRVLAVRAEPPEVLLDAGSTTIPPVTVDALVVDPRAEAGAEVEWELWVCTPEEWTCAEAARRVLVKRQRGPIDSVSAELLPEPELLAAALATDPMRGFGGIPLLVHLLVRRGPDVDEAVKRVVYGTFRPPEKTPNSNPALVRVTAGGEEIDAGWQVHEGRGLTLLPEAAPGDKERYWVATFDGGKRQLEEHLSFSFFATSGKLSDATTGGKPTPFITKKSLTDFSSDWTPDGSEATAQLWIVVRDDRGGAGWIALPEAVVRRAPAAASQN